MAKTRERLRKNEQCGELVFPLLEIEGLDELGRELITRHAEAAVNGIPVAIMSRKVAPPMVFFLQFNNDEEKHKAYNWVSEQAREGKATTVTLISDNWVSDPKHGYVRPSEDPERSEAVMVTVINPAGQVVQGLSIPYCRLQGRIVWKPVLYHTRNGLAMSQGLIKSWTDAGTRWWAVAFNNGTVVSVLADRDDDAVQQARDVLVQNNLNLTVLAAIDMLGAVPPPEARYCLMSLDDASEAPEKTGRQEEMLKDKGRVTKEVGRKNHGQGKVTFTYREFENGVKYFNITEFDDGDALVERAEYRDGQKHFGISYHGQTTRVQRVEFPDGQKQFATTNFPDGKQTAERVEFVDGCRLFNVTRFPDGRQTTERVEFVDGCRVFNVTRFPDGKSTVEREEMPDGQTHFYIVRFPDGKEIQDREMYDRETWGSVAEAFVPSSEEGDITLEDVLGSDRRSA